MSVEPGAIVILALGLGSIGIYAAALALGLRHGIDWDHLAAITDITSTTLAVDDEEEAWLIAEPGVMLTDERHHATHGPHGGHDDEAGLEDPAPGRGADLMEPADRRGGVALLTRPIARGKPQKTAFFYGTLYALGHGTVNIALGMAAILAAEVLPSWIDPIMERVVGVTLVFLSAYLFYSLYRFFRGEGDFRLRSRWMLVFAGVANAWSWIRSRLGPHEHVHVRATGQYGARTSFGIGMVHGIGAETGTQALIIATAAGATNRTTGVLVLLVFVAGLVIANSFITLTSTFGFVSARRRQWIYIGLGFAAAIFSLAIGLFFLGASAGMLPNLDRFVRWIGGPKG